MKLCAIITKDDLSSVIDQVTPLRVAIRPRRVIALGRPTNVELVAGRGLRIRGDARFTWDVGGITIPVTLRAWQVMLVPSFVARGSGHVLAFDPVLEDLDFKAVPMFLDGRIADAVKNGLEAQRGRLAWDFERHLSVTHALPSSVSPAGDVKLAPTGGNVTVTDTDIRLTLEFALSVRRDREVEAAPESRPAPSSRAQQGSPSSRSARA